MKQKKKHHEHSEEAKTKSEEEIKVDFSDIGKKITETTKKTATFLGSETGKKTLIWTLIVLLIVISSWYRLYPVSLPITDDWVRDSVAQNVKSQIASQIQAERPALPQSTLVQLTEQQYAQWYQANKNQVEEQVKAQSIKYKEQLQDENGQTYLLAIDPYLWYSYAKWHEKTGFYGNEVVNGEEKFTLRNGRIGEKSTIVVPSMFIVTTHKIIHIFNPNQGIMATAFLMPAILIGLAIIPAFFLGRKFGGNAGGFFAAFIFALSTPILGRTAAGFSDTDAYTLIFPFLIVWLFLETIEAKKLRNQLILGALTALSTVIFKFIWGGWWFTFDLILGLTVITIAYKAIKTWLDKKDKNKNYFGTAIKNSRPELIFLGTFIALTILFTALLSPLMQRSVSLQVADTISAPIQPLNFVLGFKGAAEGISIGTGSGLNYALWPNVLTTVAELNPGSPGALIAGGGGIWLVLAAVLGVVLLMFKKKDGEWYPLYGIMLAIWLASTYYAGLVGIRFIALFAPVIAFGIAGLVGSLTGARMMAFAKKAEIDYRIIKYGVIAIMFVFLLAPISGAPAMMRTADAVAKSEIPSYDDTWEKALLTIKASSEDAIITSWWDFGHWFQSRSERSVTFDGGDQGKRIHWVGLSLLTSEEDEAIDILKMLNCGQEESYNQILEVTQDKLEATNLIKKIIRMERDEAKEELTTNGFTDEEAEKVLGYSHCEDLKDMYYIVSEDMVGKSGVWGHFGSWDFNKSYMYYKLKKMPSMDAIKEATEVLGYSEQEARRLYLESQTINTEAEANQWISPWPNYITGLVGCTETEDLINCGINAQIGTTNGMATVLSRILINKTDNEETSLIIQAVDPNTGTVLSQNAIKPNSVVITAQDEFQKVTFENSTFPYDILLTKTTEGTYQAMIVHPLLTESMFTRLFFLEGFATEHFTKVFDETSFRGQRIIVYKVNP